LNAAIAISMCIPQICVQWYTHSAHSSLYMFSARSNVTCIAGSECCIGSQHWHFFRQSTYFLKESNWASALCWKGRTAQKHPASMRPFLTRVQGQVAFRWLGSCIYFSACSTIYFGTSCRRLEVAESACTCAPQHPLLCVSDLAACAFGTAARKFLLGRRIWRPWYSDC
jgi:hypothetical protein